MMSSILRTRMLKRCCLSRSLVRHHEMPALSMTQRKTREWLPWHLHR
jgi:hypothetical protein